MGYGGGDVAEKAADTVTEQATGLHERIRTAAGIVSDMLPPSPLNKEAGQPSPEPEGLTAVLIAARADVDGLLSKLSNLQSRLGRL